MDKLSDLSKKLQGMSAQPQWHYLQSPLTSTSWDGDTFSTTTPTLIDLSAVFGVPAGVNAILARVEASDSATWGTNNLYMALGPSYTYFYALTCRTFGGNVKNTVAQPVPCNKDGDVYYRILASGSGTMSVLFQILGYLI